MNHSGLDHADLLGGLALRLAGARLGALNMMDGIAHQIIEFFQRSANQKSRLSVLALERLRYEEL